MILVVDDHDDTRHVLTRMLKKLNCEATGVTNGAEALLFLKSHKPKLIILDYNMPGMNGLEVLQVIRGDPQFRAIPVVIFSADASSERKEEATRLGAQGYVVKGSLDWANLSTLIDKYACKTTLEPSDATNKSNAPEGI